MARAANRFESSTCSVLARTRVHVIGAISFPKKKKKKQSVGNDKSIRTLPAKDFIDVSFNTIT